MQLLHLFWTGVFLAVGLATRDCMRRPRQTAQGWRRMQPLVLVIVGGAFIFLVVNLLRLGPGLSPWLAGRAVQMVGLAVISTILFCGGWTSVVRAGHVGLFERVRRRTAELPTPSPWKAAVETVGVALAIVLFSVVLLRHMQLAPPIRERLSSPDNLDVRTGAFVLLILLLAPIWEEITFRWYMLNRLGEALERWRLGWPAAIVLNSALWSCGHASWTDPPWVKLVQIFVIGVLFSWRFRVIGLSGCILAHLALNSLPIIKLLRGG